MLPWFTSDRKNKRPTFILESGGSECYRDSLPTVKVNILHLFQSPNQCYCDSLPTVRSKNPTFILESDGSEYLPWFTSDRKSKHPTFILESGESECYRDSLPTVKVNIRHLFRVGRIRMLPFEPLYSKVLKKCLYYPENYLESFLML